MRIVHVLEPSDGGVAKYVHDLAAAQVAAGHAVFASASPRHGYPERLRAAGVRVAEVAMRPEWTAAGADARAVRPLTALLRSAAPDVVHTHGIKGGIIGRPVAAALRRPIVHSPHGFVHLSQRNRPRRGMEVRRTLSLAVERALAPLTREIVCVCEDERRAALEDGIARPARLSVVHNGIVPFDPGPPHPELRDIPGDGPVLGFLARFHEGKAPGRFVQALARLRDRGIAARGALVGEGPLEDEVRREVAAAGLGDRVRVARFDGDPRPYLSAFDGYVLPTMWESLPLGVLEAMSARLPVVASDVGGMAEAVLDGRTGLLVPAGDTEALAVALERLSADAAARRAMGQAGRELLEREFTFDRQVAGMEAAYRRALRWASASS